MTDVHESHTFFIGDDWEIEGELVDADDAPYDLTNVTLEWRLDKGANTTIAFGTVTVVKVDALNGLIQLVVPRALTAAITKGKYKDRLRIHDLILDQVITMWIGEIVVDK
jgi:hypothetical protein